MPPTSRPAPVTIDDLAEPRFSEDAAAVRAMMAEAGASLSLDPQAVMAAASSETGLDDFGPTDFVERLEVLCRALRTEADLNAVGVMSQHAMLTGLLRNRLLVEDLVRRHPEILEVEISRPIVICGLPRTGTTHLHNLMSADAGLRSLPYWESVEPVPAEPDSRRARTEQSLGFLEMAMPYFKRMHEMTVDHVHEEIQLLAIDISTMLFETLAPMPTWRDHYLARDQRPSYAYLKKILQAMQWLRGGTRWVLKSPQHLEQLPALHDTFPDAIFVLTHRDPVSVTASMCTMLAYGARMSRDHVDVVGISRYWADRLERMLRACVRDRDRLPADRSIDVRFDEFMADDVAMVGRIYALAGRPMTDAVRAAMAGFMAEHPRGRHGAVNYDLAALGLDGGERRRALAFYVERFGVSEETQDG
ncbi:MAG TPA: sulfotransferase [Acidimicrobiales bacterium]|nr:sulfotransferase [Acidimicrobiales bacterium]